MKTITYWFTPIGSFYNVLTGEWEHELRRYDCVDENDFNRVIKLINDNPDKYRIQAIIEHN